MNNEQRNRGTEEQRMFDLRSVLAKEIEKRKAKGNL